MSLVKLYVEGDFNDADYSTTSVDIDLDRKLLTDDEPFKSDILNFCVRYKSYFAQYLRSRLRY